MWFTVNFSSICPICKIQTGCPHMSNCQEILQNYSPLCPVYTIKISSQSINPWFIKNHARQHTQICSDRNSCNLEIKPLFFYSSKCCETKSITTICVLEFIKTTPSLLIHSIWFNTYFSCYKHQICHRDSFSTYCYKIINKKAMRLNSICVFLYL